MAQRIDPRSEAATQNNAWLERIAWNAAALAALAVMLLVLLGSLECLDHWGPEAKAAARGANGANAAAPASTGSEKAVMARRRNPRGRGTSMRALALPDPVGESAGCEPPIGTG